ncbi:3'3'-cGAMP-specific phosphodiesterase 1 [bioreactor metagenome]|uniref:3'3'-cGAMP-specific phosphodiesterase 1 n=1 Tax=bioreactor metagenome TaxID=1076179 RepID=A0A645FC31_9ZZZZ
MLIDPKRDVLGQIPSICEHILAGAGGLFMPELVETLLSISGHEYVWLDLVYDDILAVMPKNIHALDVELSLDEMVVLTEVFAHIIDFRSPFTARHSVGVAAVAAKLAELMGFSANECKMMLAAGHLHDLGKLAVPNEILEKADKLNPEEFNQMRSHTYFTYRTLQMIKGFETINIWASLHHERLNGKGYPFHLSGESIPLGSRVMAVADVFTAITEDRPYRKGMEEDAVLRVIRSMVKNESLCPKAAHVLQENLDVLSRVRLMAQTRADRKYQLVRNMESAVR